MPQFDVFSFFVQIFWLFLFICIFYLLYLKLYITRVAEVFKLRAKIKHFASKLENKSVPLYDSIIKTIFK